MRHHWTRERSREVARMYGEGKTDDEIGGALGLTPRAVECHRRRNGITGPRRRREFLEAKTSALIEELEARGYAVTITTAIGAVG